MKNPSQMNKPPFGYGLFCIKSLQKILAKFIKKAYGRDILLSKQRYRM